MGPYFLQTCRVVKDPACEALKGKINKSPTVLMQHRLVLVFNPSGDVKGTCRATHLINISSVFIWQHSAILSRLSLQHKNNGGMFIIYTC